MADIQSIIEVLDLLRSHNSRIGSYQMHTINTSTLNFSVKLSNGIIQISQEAVQDIKNAKPLEQDIDQMLSTFRPIN
jgi:RNase P/RNase MRP subunit POP5